MTVYSKPCVKLSAKMMFLDIMIGYFIPDLFGWFFLVFVITLETFLLRKLLGNGKIELKTLLFLVTVANILTTIIGYGIGELMNLDYRSHIGHLINITPIYFYGGEYMFREAIYIYVISFLATMIFETLILYFGLKKHGLRLKEIFRKSLVINSLSYFIGLIIICVYFTCFQIK